MTPFYAHTHPDYPEKPDTWEPLFSEDCATLNGVLCEQCTNLSPYHGHLNKAAYLAGKFAAEMFPENSEEAQNAAQWGRLAGWWHDLGKFAPEWQAYLKQKVDPHQDEVSGKVDHSTAGAQFSEKNLPLLGTLFAYIIAGHHAGLPNGFDASSSNLETRLHKKLPEHLAHVSKKILQIPQLKPPAPLALQSGHSLGFFIRLLFSALVDADFLATEAFMNPKQADARPQEQASPQALETTLDAYLNELTQKASNTPVNRIREEILTYCRSAAEEQPGLFSLTVPTGGGKTLSSLAFAVKHARIHNLRRIIYVIPYTSIIEQNADVFRKAFASLGNDIVVEHHSNLDPDSENATVTSRLSAENWDATLIVTTNVQFFESLYANKTSRCRKLHRLPRSVIILDEAQSIPLEFLNPCLRQIEELTNRYQSTVVLCTATQPAINRSNDFPIGLQEPHEIIPKPSELYEQLRRVQSTVLPDPISDENLIERLTEHTQVLCIVNTRRHARQLYERLPKDGSPFHLSALMCPEHRNEILQQIKERLKNQQPVRLISTQLIEAGVDIDFPVVFRSLAGLDSIAQAAGRCDREGRLTARSNQPAGKLFVFTPQDAPPPPFIQPCVNAASQTLGTKPADILGLEAIRDYFARHYWDNKNATDTKHILDCSPKELFSTSDLLCFEFTKCAQSFQLIDDYSEAVIIPHRKKGEQLCEELRTTFDPTKLRRLSRKLQRYTVTIPKPHHSELLQAGIITAHHEDRFYILNSTPHYQATYGLHPKANLNLTTEQSIL